ncbi:MAG: DUF4445 domain-containing protein [Clostridia bacterium]|nr:DUF4445 domain-containing protein [Clostridia bacterium]
MPRVEIDNRIIEVPVGTTVSAVVEGLSLPCSGKGICGKCRVQVTGGVSDPTPQEERHLTLMELADDIRLACCTTIQGDCRIHRLGYATPVVVDAPRRAIQPHRIGFSRYGVAVDVGTTTLAAHLYDVTGALLAQIGAPNPQSAYGADVISRVEAAMGGNTAPTATIRDGLRRLLCDLTARAGVTPAEVDALVITGNTVMLSLLTATDVTPFAATPFACERLFGEVVSAETVGLTDCPNAAVYLAPCISAFVGGDTATALLAADLKENELLLDIGTNGEMALQTARGLYVCSTAAGPAFEGVGISCGMPADQGAIHRVELVNGALHPTVVGGGEPKGICGSGLIDAVACLLLRGDITPEGIVDSAVSISDGVTLIPDDVRAMQVSKSAIRSGIDTLLRAANLTAEDVASVTVCGGFGNYLSIPNAVRIGLLPAAALSRTRCLGNAALSGAAQLLLDVDRRESLAARMRSARTVELATDPYFATRFMTNMRLEASE